MTIYVIGDVQGCDAALQHLLDQLDFSPSRDTVHLLGDLVNRGPDSVGVLRRLMGYGASARCLLGNHDLHLLALAHGVRRPHRKDTLTDVLTAPDRDALLAWLHCQHLAERLRRDDQDVLLVHAGVLPSWSADKTMALSGEVEAVLRGNQPGEFLQAMYGDTPDQWHDDLRGTARLRVIVNTLTRLRFCSADGHMEFASKDGANTAPAGFMPWFDVPGRATAGVPILFGHWSTLGWLGRDDVVSLDSGCVWGGALSALRIDHQTWRSPLVQSLIQVRCAQAQTPG